MTSDDRATFRSAPAALSAQGGRIDLFAHGEDRRPYHRVWTGGSWSEWLRGTPEGSFA